MKLVHFAMIVFASLLPCANAQQPASAALGTNDLCAAHPRASFEVATVKPSATPPGHNSMNGGTDSLKATMTLDRLIQHAYDLRTFQLSGGPGWIGNAVWDIQAKIDPPETSPAGLDPAARQAWIDRQRERLQSLLADRFQLKCHFEVKQLPVYDLEVGKGGPKIQQTTAAESKQHSTNLNENRRSAEFTGVGITMGEAATALSSELERMVIDKTGLTGKYDLHMTWTPESGSAAETDAPAGPTIFTAVEEQLGLKLVPAKGPVPVLVIDSVEKPSEN